MVAASYRSAGMAFNPARNADGEERHPLPHVDEDHRRHGQRRVGQPARGPAVDQVRAGQQRPDPRVGEQHVDAAEDRVEQRAPAERRHHRRHHPRHQEQPGQHGPPTTPMVQQQGRGQPQHHLEHLGVRGEDERVHHARAELLVADEGDVVVQADEHAVLPVPFRRAGDDRPGDRHEHEPADQHGRGRQKQCRQPPVTTQPPLGRREGAGPRRRGCPRRRGRRWTDRRHCGSPCWVKICTIFAWAACHGLRGRRSLDDLLHHVGEDVGRRRRPAGPRWPSAGSSGRSSWTAAATVG